MKNILIVDDQKRLKDLCRKALSSDVYRLATTDDIAAVLKDVKRFHPDLILLYVGADQAHNGWDVLLDIKMQAPSVPVVLLVDPEKGLFDVRLSQADGYVVNDCFVAEDLKQKTAQVFDQAATV